MKCSRKSIAFVLAHVLPFPRDLKSAGIETRAQRIVVLLHFICLQRSKCKVDLSKKNIKILQNILYCSYFRNLHISRFKNKLLWKCICGFFKWFIFLTQNLRNIPKAQDSKQWIKMNTCIKQNKWGKFWLQLQNL